MLVNGHWILAKYCYIKKCPAKQGKKLHSIKFYVNKYEDIVYPGITVYNQNVSKLNKQDLEIELNQINIKATRGEGMGFVGKREGVEAQAIVLLETLWFYLLGCVLI